MIGPMSGFLREERVGVLAVQLADGRPYAASLRFAHQEEPRLEFYFVTACDSEKARYMADGKAVPASVVVGFSEDRWITLQSKGEARLILTPPEKEAVGAVFFDKFPEWETYRDDPEIVLVRFTADWWKYSNLATEEKVVLTSDRH